MSIARKIRFVLLAVWVSGAPMVTAARADDAQNTVSYRMTATQATEIATKFCRGIGRPDLKPTDILSPDLSQKEDVTVQHRHPQWRLYLEKPDDAADCARMDVDDSTGDIVMYIGSLEAPGVDGEADAIPKSEAIAQATDALTKAGAFRSGELKFENADFGSHRVNIMDDAEWTVSWSRVIKSIPYRDEGANVSINAANGQVMSFGVIFHAPPPDSTDTNISKEQATTVAVEQLTAAGLAPPAPPKVKEEVIRPNTFWRTGSTGDIAPYARHAWTFRYKVGAYYAEVWVDAQTGAVIGGEYSGGRGGLTLDKKAAQAAAKPAPAAPSVTPAKTPAKK